MGNGYVYQALQRTAWNSAGRSQDGVAVMFRDEMFKLISQHKVCFQEFGIPQDRVALLVTLADARKQIEGERTEMQSLSVLCTHLTYPHSLYDEEARLDQVRVCIGATERFVPRGAPLIVVGDLNGPSNDVVGQQLQQAGLANGWEVVHGKPCRTTHQDHRGREFASDHVWYRGPIKPTAAELVPKGVPD